MGKSSFRTPKFQNLKKKWYKKLKESGFDDIEDEGADNKYLKSYHSTYFQSKYDPTAFKLKQDYFYKATHFLANHTFDTSQEKQIWKLHTEGFSLREIAERLNSKKTPMNKDKVHGIVQKYQKILAGKK